MSLINKNGNCPICDKELNVQTWTEQGVGEVERLEECKNDNCSMYKWHYSYGLLEVKIDDFSCRVHPYVWGEQQNMDLINLFESLIENVRKSFHNE